MQQIRGLLQHERHSGLLSQVQHNVIYFVKVTTPVVQCLPAVGQSDAVCLVFVRHGGALNPLPRRTRRLLLRHQ